MNAKTISIDSLGSLKKFPQEGGRGVIYFLPPNKLVKVYDAADFKEATDISIRLKTIRTHFAMFENIRNFCAAPEVFIEQEKNGQLIGFQMEEFLNFLTFGKLLDLDFCIKSKVRIRNIFYVFLALHDAITEIHKNGFLIGDLNEDNILFQIADKQTLVRFVDVDSWAIRKNSILVLTPEAITPTFCHPELENNRNCIQQHHDWYSFAVLLARSLIKNDPFNTGVLSKSAMQAIKGVSQRKGISCWDPRVQLGADEAIFVRRFGNDLTELLQKWLTGNERGIFPKKALIEFLSNLGFCKGCTLEVHLDHQKCTRCGGTLTPPLKRSSQKSTASQKPDSDIVRKLFAMGG